MPFAGDPESLHMWRSMEESFPEVEAMYGLFERSSKVQQEISLNGHGKAQLLVMPALEKGLSVTEYVRQEAMKLASGAPAVTESMAELFDQWVDVEVMLKDFLKDSQFEQAA